jgi:hypothetical protein
MNIQQRKDLVHGNTPAKPVHVKQSHPSTDDADFGRVFALKQEPNLKPTHDSGTKPQSDVSSGRTQRVLSRQGIKRQLPQAVKAQANVKPVTTGKRGRAAAEAVARDGVAHRHIHAEKVGAAGKNAESLSGSAAPIEAASSAFSPRNEGGSSGSQSDGGSKKR